MVHPSEAQNTTTTTPLIDAPVLDWSTTPLAQDHQGRYVKIIDDLFTPAECAALIALAESDAQWAQAAVNYGLAAHENYVNTDYRHSERILRFDREAAEGIYEKLKPYVQEFIELKAGDEWEGIVGRKGNVSGTWTLVGVNERLSFLRYGPGNYFRGHCDGQLELPDGRKSRVTLQVYLGDDGVEGGATRIYGSKDRFIDVEPKKGRVLIFQQRDIWHSGEDVTKGLKYAMRSDFMFRHSDDPEGSKIKGSGKTLY
ncbi:oxidoreductase [Crassisporium funariophilum]|nr:oxidoreductase [Crassisporium funariophilum]